MDMNVYNINRMVSVLIASWFFHTLIMTRAKRSYNRQRGQIIDVTMFWGQIVTSRRLESHYQKIFAVTSHNE